MRDIIFSLAEYGADHEPEKQAKKWRPGSLGEHKSGRRVQRAAIFFIWIRHNSLKRNPRKSKEFSLVFLAFPSTETRPKVVSYLRRLELGRLGAPHWIFLIGQVGRQRPGSKTTGSGERA
jgi:hypothetical protein